MTSEPPAQPVPIATPSASSSSASGSGIPWRAPVQLLGGGAAGAGLMAFLERASATSIMAFGIFWLASLVTGMVAAIAKSWSDGTLQHRRVAEKAEQREQEWKQLANDNARGWMGALSVAQTSSLTARAATEIARDQTHKENQTPPTDG